MENNQVPELGVEQESGPKITQKPEEIDINQEKQADEMPGLEVCRKPMETCLDTAVETDINPEEQADQEARSEVNQKPAETCQDTLTEADVNLEKQTANPGTIYRRKRCRRMVATQEYVVTHEVGLGERCFLRHKTYHVDDKEPECTCIFVEPMKWMQAVEEGYVSNKLWCMGCKTRLGSFNWAGMQCSCRAWVIPAFQLLKSRIDESHM